MTELQLIIGWVLVAALIAAAAWSGRSYRALRAAVEAGDRSALIGAYRSTVIGSLLAAAMAFAAIGPELVSWPRESRLVRPTWASVAPLVIGFVIGGILGGVAAIRHRRLISIDHVAALVPRTGPERRWWVVVSINAGITEELVFRGFLVHFGLDGIGLDGWWLLVLAVVFFSVQHLYQGLRGLLSTGLAGAVLMALYVVSGHLWLSMALHAAIDLRLLLESRPQTTTTRF